MWHISILTWLRRIPGPKREKVMEGEENCRMKSYIL
jgi:hypothetical protein